MNAFETELGLIGDLARAVDEMGWLLPTDIQSEAIPQILGGGDVLMAAETGSGKTGAFCLPVLQIVYEHLYNLEHPAQVKQIGSPKISTFDKADGFDVDVGGLLCQSADARAWNGARSTVGISVSNMTENVIGAYFECSMKSSGICRIGWSALNASLDLGTDPFGFGYGGTGKKASAGQFADYGEPFGEGDCIGVYFNFNQLTIGWTKNGRLLGDAYKILANGPIRSLFPAMSLKCCRVDMNFGDSDFKFSPPDGFLGISKLPSSLLVNSASAPVQSQENVKNAPICIVIEPSRELAEQTFQQFNSFKRNLNEIDIRCTLLIGGMNTRAQMDEIYNLGVHIIVATPGKLEDFIGQQAIRLDMVKFFVLDEADGLLSAGYLEMIQNIHKSIPQYSTTTDGRSSRLQMIVCSATLHNFDVKKMAEKLMHFPTWIDLKGQDTVPETVHHCVCMIDPNIDTRWRNRQTAEIALISTDGLHSNDRINFKSDTNEEALSEGIKILKFMYAAKVIAKFKMDRCLIFCRTKLDCDNLERFFSALGGGPRSISKDGTSHQFSCVCLHSDRNPAERKANLQAFKDNKVRIMICTDVAARGLDIKGLPFVINVTLPDDKSNYIHRIGRVGRAERMGLAVSLCATIPEKVWYHTCPSRGKGCHRTTLTSHGGCAIWYTEKTYLSDIEEHLGETIQSVDGEFNVPVDEFHGKVIYGRKIDQGKQRIYHDHMGLIAPIVKSLEQLERKSQKLFLQLKLATNV
ncbi:hypothetical protein ACOME3_001153 [Neoechinorhynchus agilis]